MTQGLDFDPTPFISTRQVFSETGNYTTYVFGSKLYADFWTEQMRRCTEGYTVGRYTIDTCYTVDCGWETAVWKDNYDMIVVGRYATEELAHHAKSLLAGNDLGIRESLEKIDHVS